MESFNRREHVVAAFLDVEKAFDNVWHNGLRYKIFMLDLPTKMTRWLSDFLVGRVIQVNVNGFLSDQINPAAGVPQGSVLSPLLFLIYVNDLPKPHHRQNSRSQFADDTALWAASRNVHIAAKLLQKDLRKLAKWCAKWRIKLNPEKTKVIIFSWSYLARNSEPTLKLYGEKLKFYPQVKFLGITFDSKFTFKKQLWGHPGALQFPVPPNPTFNQQKMGTQPVHHTANLQTMCPANFRIRLPFDHNNFGHNHQRNSTAPEQIYTACPAFTNIHQHKAATWLLWPSIRER